MKKLIILLCCAMVFAVAACEDDAENNAEHKRAVDQNQLKNPKIPIDAVDEAIRTEAVQRMGIIYRRVKFKVATGVPDKAAFYRKISGKVNGSTLSALGLSEADLTGKYYKPSDYTIVITGRTMTIQASNPGTRGRVEPRKYQLP